MSLSFGPKGPTYLYFGPSFSREVTILHPSPSLLDLPALMMSRHRFDAAENKARAAEEKIPLAKSLESVLEATINTAELYVQALRLAPANRDKARVDGKCKEYLEKAETLKGVHIGAEVFDRAGTADAVPKPNLEHPISKRKLTTREEIILLEGSKLNDFIFHPWKSEPTPRSFALNEGEERFVDFPAPRLSHLQLKTFAGWKKPSEALGKLHILRDEVRLPTEPTMLSMGKVDLVQDMTSDCSVVASLCAISARSERGHATLLSSVMFPRDRNGIWPALSPSSKYILRLYFNGCYRRVVLDDLLPTSTDCRVFHVVDRYSPGNLWPALVEKAYLKVWGGYDFPGSNSGTDIAVLTGWLPEQVFLHDGEVMPEDLWTRIFRAFTFGDVLITIGSGKLSDLEQRYLGLAAEHDYAVLDMKETGTLGEMLLKNPWSEGDVWRGRPRPKHDSIGAQERHLCPRLEQLSIHRDEELAPGTFWMNMGDIFQHFENLYLNWNPGLFSYRQDYHFSWDPSTRPSVAGSFEGHPQFAIKCSHTGSMWVSLNRHFRTGDKQIRERTSHPFISLYLFDSRGRTVLLSDGAMIRGPYVDSPNTLIKLEAQSNKIYTVVPAAQGLPSTKLNFTLSAFARCPVEVFPAPKRYPSVVSKLAAWTRCTAGGSSDAADYLVNPQFSLKLPLKAEIAILIACVPREVQPKAAVHIKVVFTNGFRVTSLRTGDVVAHSGDYRLGSAAVETTLEAGSYTVICSTFEPGQLRDFELSVHTTSESPPTLVTLPNETSGRLATVSQPTVLSAGLNRVLAPVTSSRLTRATIVVRLQNKHADGTKLRSPSPLRLSLEQGQGPYKTCLAKCPASDDVEYSGIDGNVQIENFDIRPEMQCPGSGGLWLVLQRLARSNGPTQVEERFEIVIMAEERVEIGAWGHGEG